MSRWTLPGAGLYAITACLSEPGSSQPACSVLYAGRTEEEWAQQPFIGSMEGSWAWELPAGANGFAVNEEAHLVIESPVDDASALLVCSGTLLCYFYYATAELLMMRSPLSSWLAPSKAHRSHVCDTSIHDAIARRNRPVSSSTVVANSDSFITHSDTMHIARCGLVPLKRGAC